MKQNDKLHRNKVCGDISTLNFFFLVYLTARMNRKRYLSDGYNGGAGGAKPPTARNPMELP
jgi:hypothetical protein